MCKPFPESQCLIAGQAQTAPGALALVAGSVSYSYHEYHGAITKQQQTFRETGVREGDRVVIKMPPSADYCVTLWALFRARAAACPINPSLPQKSVEAILGILKPAWIIQDGMMSRAGDTSRPCPESNATHEKRPVHAETDRAFHSSEGIQRNRFAGGGNPACATIVLTSGSSGAPRAAAHTLDNHLAAARAANRNMPLAPGDRWLLSLPLFHVAGLAALFRCAVAGAALVVPEAGATLEDSITDLRPTHISLVPTQLRRLLESSQATHALRSVKCVLLGGAPADDELITRAFHAGVPLVRSYGMTETAAQICATSPGAPLDELLSSGRPLAKESVRIGEDGVIEVTGKTLFSGYFMGGAVCRRPVTEDGWFRTGDVGFFDEAGRLHVTGRIDAMFICGGENIQPEEIEAALCAQPNVRRAVVVPLADKEYGAVPAAFLEMTDACAPDADALRAALAQRLPRFKIPRRFLPWPKAVAPGMKASRKTLAEMAARLADNE